MLTLHTLNKTAKDTLLNNKLSQVLSEDDSVILIENGVYQCLNLNAEYDHNIPTFRWANKAKAIYALKEDAMARGINTQTKSVKFISYTEFVELSLKHEKVISWY